jgi:excisionase family DNA binding protein
MDTATKEMLTAREVAERLDIGLRTIWKWTAEGRFPAPVRWGRTGRVVRWRLKDIERFVECGPEA